MSGPNHQTPLPASQTVAGASSEAQGPVSVSVSSRGGVGCPFQRKPAREFRPIDGMAAFAGEEQICQLEAAGADSNLVRTLASLKASAASSSSSESKVPEIPV